ncbi:MAG: translation elongation factor-like protein [Candidatus Portnoybacteria bacterium]|nr:translation elongation factor-like protein [Candidatus Portnoybacteria bacterium]
MPEEKLIGRISHFFNNISVGIIDLSDSLAVGDKIHIKGVSTDIEQMVDSMQIDRKDVPSAFSGEVGIKVSGKVKEGDEVFKIV